MTNSALRPVGDMPSVAFAGCSRGCGTGGRATRRRGTASAWRVTLVILSLAGVSVAAQLPIPGPGDEAQRLNERIRALQAEAARLAGQATTLVGELRKLEIERNLRAEEARQAERAFADAEGQLKAATDRLSTLENERASQLPTLRAQLVDIYKHGRAGYARLLLGADSFREFARATRAVAALAAINQQRLAEHRATLDALRQERTQLERTTRDLAAQDAAARRARAAAERAVAAHVALVARIDSRRDLNAQFVGELQVAYERLQQRIEGLDAEAPAATETAAALAPVRGALEWPADGQVTGRFGQTSGRLGGTAVRNGIEIAAAEGSPVRAVHGGTIGFAGPFTGFGTLVIVDHAGDSYSLYGYLDSTSVEQGQAIESGAELGRVGRAPAGPPALYFEMRIDGRSVDPLQWLERP